MSIDETRLALEMLGDHIAAVLKPDHGASKLSMTTLKSGALATTFLAKVAGARAVVKIFAEGHDAHQEFEREKTALTGFNGLSIPDLMFVSEPERLLMMKYIDGSSMADHITGANLSDRAHQLGEWFATLFNASPKKPDSNDWSTYLQAYESDLKSDVLTEQEKVLGATKITVQSLAHNDNAMSNFIVAGDGAIFGIDFAQARFKPEGWDLITAARALFLKFPENLPEVSASLVAGYKDKAADSGLTDQFDQIISIACIANLVALAQI